MMLFALFLIGPEVPRLARSLINRGFHWIQEYPFNR
jgi:NAD-dependent oxidoreductase involved in siderophore biosynthesis